MVAVGQRHDQVGLAEEGAFSYDGQGLPEQGMFRVGN